MLPIKKMSMITRGQAGSQKYFNFSVVYEDDSTMELLFDDYSCAVKMQHQFFESNRDQTDQRIEIIQE